MIETRGNYVALLYRDYRQGEKPLPEIVVAEGKEIPVYAVPSRQRFVSVDSAGTPVCDHIFDVTAMVSPQSLGIGIQDTHFGGWPWAADRTGKQGKLPAPSVEVFSRIVSRADWMMSIGDFTEMFSTPPDELFASATWREWVRLAKAGALPPRFLVYGNHDDPWLAEEFTHQYPPGVDEQLADVFPIRGDTLVVYNRQTNSMIYGVHGHQLALSKKDPSVVSKIAHHIPPELVPAVSKGMGASVYLFGQAAYEHLYRGKSVREGGEKTFLSQLVNPNGSGETVFDRELAHFSPALRASGLVPPGIDHPPATSFLQESVARRGTLYPDRRVPLTLQLYSGHFHAPSETMLSVSDHLKGLNIRSYNGGMLLPDRLRVAVIRPGMGKIYDRQEIYER